MPERFAAAAALLREAIAGGPSPPPPSKSDAPRTALARCDRPADLRPRLPAGRSRDDLRSGVADQGHRHDDARDARRRRRPAERSTTGSSAGCREWRGADRDDVTIRDLLAHASACRPTCPSSATTPGRFEFEHAICSLPLEYPPRIAVDLQRPRLHPARVHPRGRAAVGTGVPRRARRARPVAQPRDAVPPAGVVLHGRAAQLQSASCVAGPHRADRDRRVARTAARRRGARREHVGARRRGGARGAVRNGRRRRRLRPRRAAHDRRRADRRQPRDDARVHRRTDVPGSSRALGWDTMLPTSSCGTGCRRAPSATPASRARRSGLTGSAISTWCS